MPKQWIKVNEDNVIEQVAYLDDAEPTFLNKVDPGNWIEAGSTEVDAPRFRRASIGFLYDAELNACVDFQPYPSWTLSLETFEYEAPVPMPEDGADYLWDEASLSWIAN